MSIKFTGEVFQLKGMDAAQFIREEGHSIIKVFIGFLKGKSVTHDDYLNNLLDYSIDSKNNHSPKLLQNFHEAKKIHNRTIEKSVSITSEVTVFGTDHGDRERDTDLKASRTNEIEVSDKTFSLRVRQDDLFELIKERIEINGYNLSMFDNKESSEIMEKLESLDIFHTSEIDDIRKDLADELDTSPYWK